MNDHTNGISQDMYSSASSDDQSSVNTVIHVFGNNEHADTPDSERQNELGNADDSSVGLIVKDDEDSTSDSDDEHLNRGAQDSDSSSTSEDTQEWVQNATQNRGKPTIPPKPQYRQASTQSSGTTPGGGLGSVRHSLVSQNSATGRVETKLLQSEEHLNGDSGYINESPDVTMQQYSHTGDSHSLVNIHHQHHHHQQQHGQTSSSTSSTPRPASHCSTQAASHIYYPQTSQGGITHHHHRRHSSQGAHSQEPAVLYQSTPAASSQLSPSNSHIVVLPPPTSMMVTNTTTSSQPHPTSPTLNLSTAAQRIQSHALLRESVYTTLSLLYGLCITLLGTAVPLTQIWTTNMCPAIYEGFYIVLFAISMTFLLYVYMCLLRAQPRPRPRKPPDTRHPLITKSPAKSRPTDNGHVGNFFIRLGFVGFGVGALILEGLEFGQLFEVELTTECIDVIQAVRPLMQLIFVFMQMYFVFLNGRMALWTFKCLAWFGLMHLIATNLCMWIRTIVVETMRDVNQRSPAQHQPLLPADVYYVMVNNTNAAQQEVNVAMATANVTPEMVVNYRTNEEQVSDIGTPTATDTSDGMNTTDVLVCQKQDIMTTVVMAASPYLYPCTVAYCLIATAILFMKWYCVGQMPSPHHQKQQQQQQRSSPEESSSSSPGSRGKSNSVDCAGANKGLFVGVFTLVAVIISMIVFFVLVDKNQSVAVLVVHGAEILLYLLALLALIVATIRVRNMRYNPKVDQSKVLEKSLLLVSLLGVLSLCVFNIIAGSQRIHTVGGSLLVAANALILVESITQTVFIMSSMHYRSRTTFHVEKKPGRECITFVLVANVAMWGINIFEVLRMYSSPVALTFYGVLPWAVVSHLTIPLAIFYRFHATVCLLTIWMGIYKKK